ncbi:UPF0319 protein [Psychromonas marina]|uniref:UPF0319 protein n=1 Tax=Psychromonas marina TaxID=88364 RepID=A0ABQ6E2W8_9GAMM|nr:DUF2057 domain-containing protein [Psychromonas marina]GLS91535.1 UPF0319 protein [Psychromonas marina]
MKKIATILALMFMHNSYALEVQGINGVEILAIDGKKVGSSLFSRDKELDLPAGEHQIVVRFSKKFYNDLQVQSRPSIFNIDLQQDTKISVSGLNTDYKAERAIREGIEWQVISEDSEYSIKESDILMDNGFLPYSNIEEVISTYNQQNSITAPATVAAVSAAVAIPVVAPTEVAPAVSETTIPLQTLYQQASREEKKAFRIWLLEQDMK